jgi:hypothetical protein
VAVHAFSDDFNEVARNEADLLRVRAIELRARAEHWAERVRELTLAAEKVEARLRDLEELLGRAPQLRLDLQTQELQGQQLRQEAVRILVEARGARQPIHYREWYSLLRDRGIVATGKDPLATFLTQIIRSPLVERVDGKSGVYRVDPASAYERARAGVAAAARELADAEDAVAGAEGDAALPRLRTVQERRSGDST